MDESSGFIVERAEAGRQAAVESRSRLLGGDDEDRLGDNLGDRWTKGVDVFVYCRLDKMMADRWERAATMSALQPYTAKGDGDKRMKL